MARAEQEQPFGKPPGRSINEVVRLNTYVGASGRPILERRAHPAFIAAQKEEGVVFRSDRHHLTDNRSLFPDRRTNTPAMEEAVLVAPAVQDTLAWINNAYFQGQTPADVTAQQAQAMAELGYWLPSYLVNRAEDPIDRTEVPDHIANLYKVSQGFLITTDALVTERGKTAIITPHDIYEAGNALRPPDGTPYLVGVQVCPAEQAIIEATAAGLLYQSGGVPQRSGLTDLLADGEFSSLQDFSNVMQKFLHFNLVQKERRARLVDEGEALLRFGANRNSPRIQEIQGEVQDIVDLITRRKAIAQRKMNVALGRNPETAPPIS